MEFKYYYFWKNNEKRAKLHGRAFKILCRLAKKSDSFAVEFENGDIEIISRRAIRKRWHI